LPTGQSHDPGLPYRGRASHSLLSDAGGRHAAEYVSLHRGEEHPPLDEQVTRLLPRLADQGYQVNQARLYGDVDGPLTGPRRRQLRRFLATVRRHRLSGSVSFTTTDPDDRAFLGAIAVKYGFTCGLPSVVRLRQYLAKHYDESRSRLHSCPAR
jgi:hypothetical protein